MRGRIYQFLRVACLILAAAACREQPTSPPPTTKSPTPTVLPTRTITPTPTEAPTLTIAPTEAARPTQTGSPAPTVVPTRPAPSPTWIPPTRTPPPPSPSPSRQAVIHYFAARAADGSPLEIADPGEIIILAWSWSGGTGATIFYKLGFQISQPYWHVGRSGSLSYTISPRARSPQRFDLFVNDAQGVAAQETVVINLRCPDSWFFEPAPDVCPAGPPLITDGAEQHFQRGVMVWNRAEDRVYALFGDGQSPAWQAYEDLFDEGEDPESDPSITPPAGLYQPIRGFGKVWREQRGVWERLGWAVDTETGYQTAIQRTPYLEHNSTYIRALSGGVWRLGPERREWEYLPVGGER